MIVLGAGLGVFTPVNNRATMAAPPRDKLGMTGRFLNMMRSLGIILGVDISGMLFMAVASAHAGSRETLHKSGDAIAFSSKPAFMEGLQVVMASLVGISLACAIFPAFRKETPHSNSCDVAAATAGIE